MLIFKSRKKLQEEIHQLKHELGEEQGKYDKLLTDLDKAKQEITAKRNIIRQQDERIERLKKQIKTQQAIIDKQNAKLGFDTKKKTRKVEDKDHDPYIEE
jgi:chromosome segregation ATPase